MNRVVIAIATLLFAMEFGSVGLTGAQPDQARPLRPGKMVSRDIALRRARRFLHDAQVPVSSAPVEARANAYVGHPQWSVTWGSDLTVIVDNDGTPVRFANRKRQRESATLTVSKPSLTVAALRKRASLLARALGLPPGSELRKVETNTPGRDGLPLPHTLTAYFAPHPHGYRFLYVGDGVGLQLDDRDGMLKSFGLQCLIPVVAWTRKIAPDRAVALARGAYVNNYRLRKKLPLGQYGPAHPARLGYVLPNGEFTAAPRGWQAEGPAKLAWAVPFGPEEVWIDAASGHVLGGVRDRPAPPFPD